MAITNGGLMGRMLPTITNKYGSIVYQTNFLTGEDDKLTTHISSLYRRRLNKYYFRHHSRCGHVEPWEKNRMWSVWMVYDAETDTITVKRNHGWAFSKAISVVVA